MREDILMLLITAGSIALCALWWLPMLVSIIRAIRAKRPVPRWAQYILQLSIFTVACGLILPMEPYLKLVILILPLFGLLWAVNIALQVSWMLWVPALAIIAFGISLRALGKWRGVGFGADILASLVLGCGLALGAAHYSSLYVITKSARAHGAHCLYIHPPMLSALTHSDPVKFYFHALIKTDEATPAHEGWQGWSYRTRDFGPISESIQYVLEPLKLKCKPLA
ncbi:MAG: hypothetical protein ACRBBK_10540 [Paracoccaceae bacterium]